MINEYEIRTKTKLNQVSPNTDFYWDDSTGFGGCVICQNEDGTTTFENSGDGNRYSERTESGEIEVYELVKLSTSLDEAINLCEASINEAKRCYQTILDNGFGERFAEVHQRNLSEYVILLGWLKELKYYKDRQDLINKSWQELIGYKEGIEKIKMRSQAYRERGEVVLASGMEQALDILKEGKK